MIHTMIDCYDANESKLNDLQFINDLLYAFALDLKLNPVMPPFLCPYYYDKNAEDVGISAFIFIKGGHITIHTFPKRQCYFADILSGEYHDSKKAVTILKENLNGKNGNLIRADRRFSANNIETLEDNLKNKTDFGLHLISKSSTPKDFSMETLFSILDSLPERIKMSAITRPYVIKNDGLLSGIILIAQSHIALHFNPATTELYSDIFSCSDFDVKKTIAELDAYCGISSTAQIITRGSKHEHEIMNQAARNKRFGLWKKGI